jgi:hypothetical protein
LRAAHIGLAMGQRGTDVAREAAALVLLDDDFSSLVHGIRQGRRIFDNLVKAMTYILAIHVPIARLSLLPVLFKHSRIASGTAGRTGYAKPMSPTRPELREARATHQGQRRPIGERSPRGTRCANRGFQKVSAIRRTGAFHA